MHKKSPISLLFTALPFLALISALVFSYWLRSLSGVQGLLEWMPSYHRVYKLMQLAGCVPLLILGVYELAAKKGNRFFMYLVIK